VTLLERIRRGEQAIAEAKAKGEDVPPEWEAHLAELKQMMAEYTPGAGECWNCGATMSKTFDIEGRPIMVCWECAGTA
jgi:hypothetical protein